jgi:hypothetical protein
MHRDGFPEPFEHKCATYPPNLPAGVRVVGMKVNTDPTLCRPINRVPLMSARHTGEGLPVPPFTGEAGIRGISVRDV